MNQAVNISTSNKNTFKVPCYVHLIIQSFSKTRYLPLNHFLKSLKNMACLYYFLCSNSFDRHPYFINQHQQIFKKKLKHKAKHRTGKIYTVTNMKLDTWIIKAAICFQMFALWLQKNDENSKKDLNMFYMGIKTIQK